MSAVGADNTQAPSTGARAFVLVVATAAASAAAVFAGHYVHELHVGLASDFRPNPVSAIVSTAPGPCRNQTGDKEAIRPVKQCRRSK
ncbi:MAG TPA: hypothetical protein VE982_01840 [Gaiellaceae bacterium]|nr:hypothetical protein [Gaiellaceae bacterium]